MAAAKKKAPAKKDNPDSTSLYTANQVGNVHVDDTTVVYLPEGSPRIGHFATVEKGEHKGKYGVVVQAIAFNSKGWPTKVNFRTRDDDNELITVDYDALREAEAGRR